MGKLAGRSSHNSGEIAPEEAWPAGNETCGHQKTSSSLGVNVMACFLEVCRVLVALGLLVGVVGLAMTAPGDEEPLPGR